MTEAIVLGAGMAGIGAALALQARGRAVTVIERGAPGGKTSYGNAGVIQAEAVIPYAMPRGAATLIRYALGLSADIAYDLRDLPAMAPALAAYFRASAPARHAEIARAYAPLIKRAASDHAPLIEAAGASDMIRRTGLGEIYRDARALDRAAAAAEPLAAEHGLGLKTLDGRAFAAEEISVALPVAGAVIWEDSWSCTDPGALVGAYAALFQRRGGRILAGDAMTLRAEAGGWRVDAAEGPVSAPNAVIALGPWAPDLTSRLGYRVRMVRKRGYHLHASNAGSLSRPYLDASHGYVLAPMRRGLRLTTGAELVRRDRPGTRRQLDRALRAAGEMFGAPLSAEGEPWYGNRPCMPGMLPLVGPAPRHKGLWFDFGHGHQGFTLGPTTGALLAEAMEGEAPEIARPLDPALHL